MEHGPYIGVVESEQRFTATKKPYNICVSYFHTFRSSCRSRCVDYIGYVVGGGVLGMEIECPGTHRFNVLANTLQIGVTRYLLFTTLVL